MSPLLTTLLAVLFVLCPAGGRTLHSLRYIRGRGSPVRYPTERHDSRVRYPTERQKGQQRFPVKRKEKFDLGPAMIGMGEILVQLSGALRMSMEPPADNSSASTTTAAPVVPDCNGTDFCSDPPTYPIQDILRLVEKSKKQLMGMFDKPEIYDARSMLSLRTADFEAEEHSVCEVEHISIRPKVGKNKDGIMKFIINTEEENLEYVQEVQTGQCLNGGSECANGRGFPDYRTQCEQQFSDHKLLVLSDDRTQIVADTFKLPSCCTCKIVYS